ncbi:4'-phosphopantetheinyl transferase superfamily protein [Streptomyces sp. NPDC054829]|nr:4'-phosphopantetheinyl transferase superfamily protein [Streptomyces sp. SBE_14.2]
MTDRRAARSRRERPGAERVDALAGLRPQLAAVGLGLGIAHVGEAGLGPAGPAEASAAATMTPDRRREFLAGRHAARRALRAIGLDCGDIPRDGRLPVFPPGRAASISHSAGIAVAVAREPTRHIPLGCDLELKPLPDNAAKLVLRADETEWLQAAPAEATLTALFSAKEAAWKALCLSSGTLGDLWARPYGDELLIGPHATPADAVRVRTLPVGKGVFSYVVGRARAGAGTAL